MNSYNENLNSSVTATLQSQELKQSNMQAQLNAAMFTLYYAEGAKITAIEKLEQANDRYAFQQMVKEKATDNNNIAVNILASANQQKQYVGQSTANTAAAAKSILVAANAIVKLASDMGSILSVLNAADFGSEIYTQASEVRNLIDDTAYNAEITSQYAMKAAYFTAEVCAPTVADMAKATTASVTNLLSVVGNQFDNTTALVTAYNNAVAQASVDEKKAEGTLEDINVEYYAARATYLLSVKEMNLDLQVKPSRNNPKHSFSISFTKYLNPFYDSLGNNPDGSQYRNDPVADYFIIVVKESKKTTFSLTAAETLLDDPQKCYKVAMGNDGKNQSIIRHFTISDLNDSDGEAIQLGKPYVVFVMAQFGNGYKKSLNNYDDFMTAASAPFTLTTQLTSPDPKEIDAKTFAKDGTRLLKFNLVADKTLDVEYRCIFLPDNSDLVKGLITEQGLRDIENEVHQLELIAAKYDPDLVTYERKVNSANATLKTLHLQLETLRQKQETANEGKPAAENSPAKAKEDDLLKQIKDEKSNHATALEQLQKTQEEKKSALTTLQPSIKAKPGFFFNLLLAEQIVAGNYTPANDAVRENGHDPKKAYKVMAISDNTTDNFGNRLMKGKKYIPVVLSYAVTSESNKDQFTNSLSDYRATKTFSHNNQ
ncbi:hypothetical protein [Flavobacterium sp.]|uniref:hypothetical protein n=1 Tax=Flavobacterium sp. TaxID=239 RepID=UPI0039E404D1